MSSIFDSVAFPEGGLFSGDPPFPLLVDKRDFFVAQVPCFENSDYFLIDLVKHDTPQMRLIIETYIREREFITTLLYLSNTIIKNCGEHFELIANKLAQPLHNLESIHIVLLNSLSRILATQMADYNAFFVEIIHTINVIPIHQQYISKFLEVEPLCHTFSLKNEKLSLDNKPTILVFKEPFTYISEIANTVEKAAKYIHPTKFNDMMDFVVTCRNILMSIDSIPILEKIAKNFLIEPFPIVEPGRRFIKQGMCLKHCRKEVSARILFLFSDFFVYAQPHGGKFMVPAAYQLSRMKIQMPKTEIFGLSVYTPRKSFVLEFKSKEELQSWYEALKSAIYNARAGDDGDFETAPIWMPDKAAQTCMICHQEHTFFVRRHHCRACGAVACANCLKYRAVVRGISSRPVKVCQKCYRKIMAAKRIPIQRVMPRPNYMMNARNVSSQEVNIQPMPESPKKDIVRNSVDITALIKTIEPGSFPINPSLKIPSQSPPPASVDINETFKPTPAVHSASPPPFMTMDMRMKENKSDDTYYYYTSSDYDYYLSD